MKNKIEIKIEDGFIEDIMMRCGVRDVCSIMSSALAFYNWYLSEIIKGRIVLSCSIDGTDMSKVII
jgi:hypothetical protein